MRAIPILALARFAVRSIAFARWQGTLGTMQRGAAPSPALHPGSTAIANAQVAADSVARAAFRLRGEVKCLPRAVATQWLLRLRRCPGSLVIAVHRDFRTGPDAFHAWVETGGTMVIGHCTRADYVPLLTFSLGHG